MEGNSFIRFMLPGFTEKLDVPRGFCKTVREGEKWTLRSRKGTWKIDVGINDEGRVCFKRGWPQFVTHHRLSIGDLIQFEQIGAHFHFNVTVFDSSRCENEFNTHVVGESSTKKKDVPSNNYDDDNNTPHQFVLTMTPYTARRSARVFIPTKFLKASNIWDKYSSLTLRDPLGREWPVKLVISTTQFRVEMHTGWHHFYVSNELKRGDDCLFELINCPSVGSTTPLLSVQIFRFKSTENGS